MNNFDISEKIDRAGFAAEILLHDDILILTHSHPDGDTAGTGIALYNALAAAGKNAKVACTDELPAHLSFLYSYANGDGLFFGKSFEGEFCPSYIV